MARVYKNWIAATLLAAVVAGSAPAAANPTFDLSFIGGTSQAAQDDFTAAANYWKSVLTDNVTITMTVGTAALGGLILGETSAAEGLVGYSSLRTALTADKTSATDTLAVANLPASALSVYVNHTSDSPSGSNSATPYVSTQASAQIHLTTANARALGYSASGASLSVASGASCASCDALIEFSTDFSWDYDRTNGINAAQYDFTGAAIHEIGHALGFISGVDMVDYFATGTPTTASVLAGFYITPLDLFRCSTASRAAGTNLDFTEDARAKYFSLDECATTGAVTFADGANATYGDGSQASHWKNGQGLGIMNPTAATGQLLSVSANDLQAFDVIGWNIAAVPEPATLALAGVWAACLGAVRRRRVRN